MWVEGKGAGRYKARKLVGFHVDYFKGSLKKTSLLLSETKLESLWLSANSNMFWINDNTYLEFKYIESLRKKYKGYYEIRDKETSVNLWFIMLARGGSMGAVELKDIVEVTGQGLILRTIQFYYDLLKFFGYEIEKFKRVDVCMDIEEDIHYIWELTKDKIQQKTHEPIWKGWVLETIYIWERDREKNTYQLIRIYDKILDTKKKNKTFLYPEHDWKKHITRHEIEFRRDKAKYLKPEHLTETRYLFKIFSAIIYPYNWQYYKFISPDDCEHIAEEAEQNKKKYILWKGIRSKAKQEALERLAYYGVEFKWPKQQLQAERTFFAYGKKLILNGYCPEKLKKWLINEGIIPDDKKNV